MTNLIYKGFIKRKHYGEKEDALFIGDMERPIAEVFQDDLQDKQVSMRYWLSNTEKTKEELLESTLLSIIGAVDAEYGDRYSECTGYLCTDENLQIGGHDLLLHLLSHNNKFIYLEIDVHI